MRASTPFSLPNIKRRSFSLFLYIEARSGPGPYLFASVFAYIGIGISMTTAVLYPYPFYLGGQVLATPLAFHCSLRIDIRYRLPRDYNRALHAHCVWRTWTPSTTSCPSITRR